MSVRELVDPTAQQSVALTQLTPARPLSSVVLVFGEVTMLQLVPFQCSMSV
jgi:hypothetical protein